MNMLDSVRDTLRHGQLLRLGPPLTASLERLVRQLGLQECILRLEGLAVDELISVYHVADALLYPSTYEGFERPVLEAMACGLQSRSC